MQPRLVLFARFPEPGRAKTRLIPRLGPAGAAGVHRKLTERCVAAMRTTSLPMEVRVTGADVAAFRDWLGDGIAFVDQGEGDLGRRLTAATAVAPVVVLGSDTPDLAVVHLTAMADALTGQPAAIGPAEDGGYWGLGLARPMPFLFADMPWSTDRVCAITLARLAEAGITPAVLDTLADCDRPEDLDRWPELAR